MASVRALSSVNLVFIVLIRTKAVRMTFNCCSIEVKSTSGAAARSSASRRCTIRKRTAVTRGWGVHATNGQCTAVIWQLW
jgi:hypothetical protein